MITYSKIETSEAVGAGHPDKICDQIADSVLDHCLQQDVNSRVACEVMASHNTIYIVGEITTKAEINIKKIAWSILKKYNYRQNDFEIIVNIQKQSSEIAKVVNHSGGHVGAGDQGFAFGFATNESDEMLPISFLIAQTLLRKVEYLRTSQTLTTIKADMKSQVSISFDQNQKPVVEMISLSIQHQPEIDLKLFRNQILNYVVNPIIKSYQTSSIFKVFINQTGPFVLGGSQADSGLTGRKIVVDSYGPTAHHGGGSYSGKDYTKIDRTGAYFARWIAKNIVAANFAHKCEVQIVYLFGSEKPIVKEIRTFGTNQIDSKLLHQIIDETFDFSLDQIINQFDLQTISYLPLATYGHFGRTEFDYGWEKLNMVNKLKQNLVKLTTINKKC